MQTTSEFTQDGHPLQLRTIVVLFILLRLTIVLMYTPQGLLNAYTNAHYYYLIGQLSEGGHYPYINMWYEYPPLSAYITQGVYYFTRTFMPPGDLHSLTFQFYFRILGIVFLFFETGVLILLHRIAVQVWNARLANWLAWIYAALSMPLFFWNTSQDCIVVFFTLLAVYLLLQERYAWSAVAVGVGMAAKLTPVLLLLPVVKLLWPDLKRIVGYGLTLGATFAAFYVPFVLIGSGRWVQASMAAIFKVGSWATPWALIDGNWGSGSYGELTNRLDLAQASVTHANPAAVSPLIPLALLLGLSAWVFFLPIQAQPGRRHVIWLTLAAIIIFHLWSKGWSPAWAGLIIPFILLAFPDGRGLKLVLWLSGLLFLEWPLAAAFESRFLLAFTIAARTVLFLWIGWLCLRRLQAQPRPA